LVGGAYVDEILMAKLLSKRPADAQEALAAI
jgi:hypothetical protein